MYLYCHKPINHNMITQKHLKQLLANPESYRVELTASTSNMDKFCQAICAFSNDMPGDGKNGYLILGAGDNGNLSDLKVDDQLLLKMTNIRTDGIFCLSRLWLSKDLLSMAGSCWLLRCNPPNFHLSGIADGYGYVWGREKASLRKPKRKYWPKGGSRIYTLLTPCLAWEQPLRM